MAHGIFYWKKPLKRSEKHKLRKLFKKRGAE